MQMINTIIAKPNKTIQLATGNSDVDALMAHQAPSMELRPEMERQSDTRGISRCHQLLPTSVPVELAQRVYLDGLQQEPAEGCKQTYVNWQNVNWQVSEDGKPSCQSQLSVVVCSSKSSGMGVKQDPTGIQAIYGSQFTGQIAFGTRTTATTKQQAYQGSYPAYSTSI